MIELKIDNAEIINALMQQNAVLNKELIMRDIAIRQLQEKLASQRGTANGRQSDGGSSEKDAGLTGLPK